MLSPLPYSRRHIVLLASCFLFWVGLGDAIPAAPQTPNIVLIIGDDQAWTDYGFMGHPQIRTPHLDRLAQEGVLYRHGYVPSSLCRPSLATIVTGLYPHQHGITCNDPPKAPRPQMLAQRRRMIARMDRAATLPRQLAQRDYLSHQSGKWWEGNYRRGGFTHGMTHGDPARGGRHGDAGLTIGRQDLKPIRTFLDEAGDRPFLLWYAPFLPHSPHNPPERLLRKYQDQVDSLHVARYRAMCEWFDETCGQLLAELKQRDKQDNTLVIFVCDNGWIQDPSSPRYAPKSKRSPYNGGLRSPIILRWPGKLAPDVVDVPVLSLDLMPTIFSACGLEVPGELPGVNLLQSDAVHARETVFGEVFTHNAVDIEVPASNLRFRWMVAGGWKLISPHAANVPDQGPELYALGDDPHEETNLATEHPGRVARMQAQLDAWWSP